MPPTSAGRGRPPERYGDATRRPRPGVVAAVVVVAAAFLGWVVWAALGAADRDPQADVTAFRVVSAESMKVRVRLAPGTDGPVGCTVQAMDRTREVVGVAGVELRADRRERWVSVRTRDRAVTATVASCLTR